MAPGVRHAYHAWTGAELVILVAVRSPSTVRPHRLHDECGLAVGCLATVGVASGVLWRQGTRSGPFDEEGSSVISRGRIALSPRVSGVGNFSPRQESPRSVPLVAIAILCRVLP
jgi:hypothetical protein